MSRRILAAALLVAAFATAATASILHDLTGRWQLAVVTDNGTGYPVLELKQEGDKVTGTYTSNAMGSRTISGTVYGDTLSFVLSPSGAGEGMVLTYTARIVTADSLNGYVDFAGQGGARFTGTRQR
ncbi:hypothetical protein Strain138_001916 [Pseudogemmatithrix spongiicola]|uniref:Lipocalin-like domain-containing protein n=1 Tax=Pseudogemmatithrix spongiicola TaxID=3062599 RepID=A0AA49K0P0_9BACT|nr:hypothetical protein Strain138_001916 [Gemmatimonadaceae bacterium 'strain 138']WKW15526.1 hypothetical protein Strain318_001915 [Gemmatimonadaceae bacterium 'strain 318']